MPAAKKAPRKAPKRATRSRKPAAARGPEPRESVIDQSADDVSALVAQVKKQGGAVVGAYRDPFAGQALVLASLPIKKVVATPFQRDLSKTHATRLADAIGDLRSTLRTRYGDKVLTPLIAPATGLLSGLLGRKSAGAGTLVALDGFAGLPDELISALETRAIWAKFGF